MTADLREAFHVAVIRFVGWSHWLDDIDHFGCHIEGTPDDQHPAPPDVEFFGRQYSIASICDLAQVLEGPVPAPLLALFDEFLNCAPHLDSSPATFPEAVEFLAGALRWELCRVRQQPHLTERLFQKGRREGVNLAFDHMAAQFDASSGESGR